jgi:hypothetical protein
MTCRFEVPNWGISTDMDHPPWCLTTNGAKNHGKQKRGSSEPRHLPQVDVMARHVWM